METLRNDKLFVSIEPEQVSARVELAGRDLAWRLGPNSDGDIWVGHGRTQTVLRAHDAPRKSVRRVKLQQEERIVVALDGLPGNTAAAISFVLPGIRQSAPRCSAAVS